MLLLGAMLLAMAALILLNAHGQIEGYFGGVLCVTGGVLNIAIGIRRPPSTHDGGAAEGGTPR